MTTGNLIPLVITGASGRMGKRLIALAVGEYSQTLQVVAALERADSPMVGQDAGKVAGAESLGVAIKPTFGDEFLGAMAAAVKAGGRAVVIDFSAPAATRALIPICVQNGAAMLVGTTGLTAEDQRLIDKAGKSIPILQAGNTSLGVNVLLNLVAQAARQLGAEFDIEIAEAHHNQKKDAPSGTALALADALCQATGKSLETDLVHGRQGDSLRTKGTIGMHALRMGDVVGEHTVYFAANGERVEIRHVATSRDIFVRGALRAAAFLGRQKPGRYTMRDVLGL